MEGVGIEVGRIAALFRYPVKSMRGEALDELEIDRGGPAGDRRYAFVRGDGPADFPYLTGRQVPDLLGYVPSFSVPEDPRSSAVRVRTPDGRDLAVESEELRQRLERAYGRPVRLLPAAAAEPYVDEAAVSLISTSTIATLGTLAGATLVARRFRPNILIEPQQGALEGESPEDGWLGATLQLGTDVGASGGRPPLIRIQQKDVRCKMINVDPDSRDTGVDLLAAMVRTRRLTAGVYASVARGGVVTVGAPVLLLA